MSSAEVNVVVRGMYSAVKDLDAPSFRNLKGARSSGGDVLVCGWMRPRTATNRSSSELCLLVGSPLTASLRINTLSERFWLNASNAASQSNSSA
jgi:hypothetical protein